MNIKVTKQNKRKNEIVKYPSTKQWKIKTYKYYFFSVILDETEKEYEQGKWQMELLNPVLHAFLKNGTIFRNPMGKTLVEVLYKIYIKLKDQ